MDNQIEEIKNRIDVVDFINRFVPLRKAGRNFKSLCPFHQEKTPSFIVSPDRQIWRCFGACQEGGDVIKFLMKWENLTFYEALKELSIKAGIKFKSPKITDRQWKKKEKLLAINALAAEFYHYILHHTPYGKKGIDYLSSRSIKIKIAEKFQLGYAPNSWDSLLKFLQKKGFSEEEIYQSGLIVKGQKGNFYDRFRGRLIFPIKDLRNNITGFSGRLLTKKNAEAKYINIPETLLYKKRQSLFGLNLAKEAIKNLNKVIIVEGEFDVISPFQYGVENIVAVKGSTLTKEQLMILKRFTKKIILALDTDQTGSEAIKKGFSEAEKLGLEIYVVQFDYAKDPDEAVRKNLLKFKEKLESPQPIYDFIIEKVLDKYKKDQPFDKKRIGDELTPFIAKIKNPIIKSFYIKRLSKILEVDEESIKILLRRQKNISRSPSSLKIPSIKNKTSSELNLQKYLLSLIFQSSDPFKTGEHIFQVIDPEDFLTPSHRKIIKQFLQFKKTAKTFKLKNFIDRLTPEIQSAFDEIYLFSSLNLPFALENLEKLILRLKRQVLKRKISSLLSIDKPNKEKELVSLTKELKSVEKRLVSL